MSIGYPHLGGYPSMNFPAGKSRGEIIDAELRGFSGPSVGGGAKLMINNINEKISRLDLEDRFRTYGKISGIQIQGTSAFLLFDREDSAVEAANREHGLMFKGCRLDVSIVPDKGSARGGDLGPRGGDMGPRDMNLRGGDMGPRGGDMGPRGGDLLPRGGDLLPRGGDMLPRGDMGPRGGDLGPRGDMGLRGDLGLRGDMGPRGGDMGPRGDLGLRGDLGPRGSDLGPRDMGPRGGDLGPRDMGPRGGDLGPRDMGPRGGDLGPRDMGRMRGGRRSPSGDRSFRDRPGMMGREDRFRDDMPGMGFDDRFPRGMDGEPFAKSGRFDPYPGTFGRNEIGLGGSLDPFRDPFTKMPGPSGPSAMKPNDCEIIVIHKNQQSYAESVEQRLRNLGLVVDLLFLREEGALTHTVDDIGRRGTLFAVVIAAQHETHGSLTLNILQGNPQEHRNMPLDDALKLIARSFHEFVQSKKKGGASGGTSNPAPMDREIRLILTLLLDGKYVTVLEMERLITYLQERRERMLGESAAIQARTPAAKITDDTSTKVVPAEQQDLQQRILNILGSSTGTPTSTDLAKSSLTSGVSPIAGVQLGMPGFNDLPLNMIGASPQQPLSQSQQSPSSNTYINFDNPSVQKALDSLIQSGPNLLKNIGMPNSNSPTLNPRGPIQNQQGMMGGPGVFNNQGAGGYGGGAGIGGMQPGYRHPTNNTNNMMGGRPQLGANNQGSGFGGRQMRY